MLRRTFLRSVIGTGAVAGLGGLSSVLVARGAPDGGLGWLASPVNPHRRVLVVVRLFGGNDGLNTLVPVNDAEYYRLRRDKSHVDISIAPEIGIPIPNSSSLRFHPAMSGISTLYNEGKVAVVQGVGYPDMDLSHFRSTNIWLSASDSDVFKLDGWMGRFLEQRLASDSLDHSAPFAVELGPQLGRAFNGEHTAMGFAYTNHRFFSEEPGPSSNENNTADLEYLLREYRSTGCRYLESISRSIDASSEPSADYFREGGNMAPDLQTVSRCIRGGMATNMYIVHTGMFDTHHFQIQIHNEQLTEVCTNLLAFQRELERDNVDNRVTTLVISEFGRRAETNTSGTDHGTAGPVFLIGSSVNGGIHGVTPQVSDLDNDGNLRWHVDFRSVYASILEQWFESKPTEYLPRVLHRPFPTLPLFRNAHHMHPPTISQWPNPASTFVTVSVGNNFTGTARLTIVDVSGQSRAVLDCQFVDGASTIDVRHLSQGAYIGNLSSFGGTAAFPLIIAR